MEIKKFTVDGLVGTFIKTDKFKTTDFILNFRTYLKKDEVTKRALVPYLLKAGTEKYPSKKAINQQLERLYGASLGISINKQGLLHILSFRMSIVNDEYLIHKQDLLNEAFQFLSEILYHPNLENGTFQDKLVKEEKRLLKDHFTSLYDDKIRYAYDQLITKMCESENYSVRSIGSLEDLEALTSENLYQSYQDMLKEDTIDFMIVGDLSEARVMDLVKKYFPFETRDRVVKIVDEEEKQIQEVKTIVEKIEINQAKLNIGYRTHVLGDGPDYYTLMMMNAMLGVYPNSLLFRNVREKNSLCYYISSNIDRAKPILVIYAGINSTDYEKALAIIKEQIVALQSGLFDDELIINTKKALINELLEMCDHPLALLASHYSHELYQETFDIDKIKKQIDDVTKADIMNIAKKLEEDTVFLLTSEEVK